MQQLGGGASSHVEDCVTRLDDQSEKKIGGKFKTPWGQLNYLLNQKSL